MKTKKIVLTAMFAALTCVATMLIHIPSPMNGYVNLGDALVLLGGFLLGAYSGFAAGGLGAMLADLFLGYSPYMAATFVIKGIMGFVAGKSVKKEGSCRFAVLGAVISEAIMILGYFAFEALILGNGISALSGVPGNMVQGTVGAAAAVTLYSVLKKNKYILSSVR